MKKILLLASAVMVGSMAMAQSGSEGIFRTNQTSLGAFPESNVSLLNTGLASKETGVAKDTIKLGTSAMKGGPYTKYYFEYAQPFKDTGLLYGPSAWGFKGWAQLWKKGYIDATGNDDTTVQLIGVVARFTGTKSASSTKSITLSMWKRGTAKVAIPNFTKAYVYGLPTGSAIVTKTVNYTSIILDSLQSHYFATPVSNVNYDYYLGYTQTYNWAAGMAGDTIGLSATAPALGNTYTVETGTLDTLVSANNIMQDATGTWKSTAYDIGVSGNDQVIFPIIKLTCATCGVGVKSYTQNNLSIFGCFPNPAANSTRIKVGLKANADVTVQIMDAAGRTVQNIEKKGLAIGEHMIDVNTSSMAAGTYVYLVRTSTGEGVAAQMTIVK